MGRAHALLAHMSHEAFCATLAAYFWACVDFGDATDRLLDGDQRKASSIARRGGFARAGRRTSLCRVVATMHAACLSPAAFSTSCSHTRRLRTR